MVRPIYTLQRLFAVSAMRGDILLSLIGPVDSALYNCIPPTPSMGNIANAKITIPIPPSHWSICLYISIDGDRFSKSSMMVAPVVVHPEIDSNKASTKLSDKSLSKMKGRLPKRLRINQNKTTIRKPSLDLISDDLILELGK